MTTDQLQDKLYDLFSAMVGTPFVWAKQAAPRPIKPYFLLDFVTFDGRAGLDELRVNGDQFSRTGIRFFTLQIDCYGNDALTLLADLRSRIYLEENVQLWAAQNFAIVDDGEVNDRTELLEAKWETRGQMDVKISYSSELEENIDYIDQAVVNGSIVG